MTRESSARPPRVGIKIDSVAMVTASIKQVGTANGNMAADSVEVDL